MGIWDAITELAEAVTPWSTAAAEAPQPDQEESKEERSEDAEDESKADTKAEAKAEAQGEAQGEPTKEETEGSEESEEAEAEAEEEDAEKEEEGDADEEEEEEEEDEEEIVDPKDKLEEECKNSKQCHDHKHHFDECVQRVHQQEAEEGGAKEDCVEEFFHLTHCAAQCAAPKLWRLLK